MGRDYTQTLPAERLGPSDVDIWGDGGAPGTKKSPKPNVGELKDQCGTSLINVPSTDLLLCLTENLVRIAKWLRRWRNNCRRVPSQVELHVIGRSAALARAFCGWRRDGQPASFVWYISAREVMVWRR